MKKEEEKARATYQQQAASLATPAKLIHERGEGTDPRVRRPAETIT